MSSAIDVPGIGNDSRPSPSAPQSLITARNDAPPREVSSSRNARTPLAPAARGITHWYCVRPRRPYSLFQWPIASSGYQNDS